MYVKDIILQIEIPFVLKPINLVTWITFVNNSKIIVSNITIWF